MVTPPDHDQIDHLAQARARVLERIGDACARAGRDPADVTLIAVSKTVDAARLRAAVAAGLTTLGENRVQEAESKVGDVPGATWHLVGPLQKNKARRALQIFETIESVDGGYQLPSDDTGTAAATAPARTVGEPVPVKRSAAYDAEDLEIPSFLRRK